MAVFALLGLALVSIGVVIGLGIVQVRERRFRGDGPPDSDRLRELFGHVSGVMVLTALVRSRSADRWIHELASDVAYANARWLGRMTGWFDVWAEPTGIETSVVDDVDVVRLRALGVRAFDLQFLRIMVRRYEDGADLADLVWESADTELVRDFADAIVESFLADDERMRDMIAQRFGW